MTHSLSPTLSWRDVQYLIVYTSDRESTYGGRAAYTVNGAGVQVSREFGFGVLDAEAMVTRARHWINVPLQLQHVDTLLSTGWVYSVLGGYTQYWVGILSTGWVYSALGGYNCIVLLPLANWVEVLTCYCVFKRKIMATFELSSLSLCISDFGYEFTTLIRM